MNMKKIIALLLCLLMAASLLTACGSNNEDVNDNSGSESVSEPATESESESQVETSTGYNLADVMAAIEAVAPVAMSMELRADIEGSNDYMTDLFGIDMALVEEYYGKLAMVNTSSDVILLIKAVPGQVEAVKTALEAARDAKASSCEMYLDSEFQKASEGRVVVKGDYALLVIAGDSVRIMDGEIDAVYAEIDAAIDGALA